MLGSFHVYHNIQLNRISLKDAKILKDERQVVFEFSLKYVLYRGANINRALGLKKRVVGIPSTLS